MSDAGMLQIEVAYATPAKQKIIPIRVPAGTSVAQCIEKSHIREHFPEINLDEQKVGIWSKAVKLDAEPRDGDRIEIYRPLIADPKEVRRRRAEQAKEDGRADKVTGGRARRRDEEASDSQQDDTQQDEETSS